MASKRTVLITGCSPGGIGHALALEFHAQGLRVFATARQPTILASLAAEGIETFPLDVTSETSMHDLYTTISNLTNGTLDMLVNNAGRNYTVPALDVDMAEVRATFDTNVFGVMRMCQLFTPLLIASAKSNQRTTSDVFHPVILNIGSLAALMPYVFGAAYNASKAALHAYTDALRLEIAPFGVRVVNAVTGGVRSRIAREKRVLPPESLYAPIRERYEERMVHSQTMGVDAAVYARGIVRGVLAEARRGRWGWAGVWGWRKEIWGGGKAGLVWALRMFLPRRVMDWALMRMFGLWLLQGKGTKRD